MDNFVIGTIQENIKTLSHSLQLLSSDAPTKISDLSDVSSTTPADGDTLVYNATDDIFEPRAQSGGGTTGSLSSIVPIYLDTVNNRVGIDITAPQYALDVLGDIRLQSGGTDRLIFHNTTAGEDIVSVDAIVEGNGGNGGIWGVRTKVNGSSLSEKIRIDNVGAIGIGGANYGTAGQVLTSNGPGSSVSWADVGAGSGGGVAEPTEMPVDATNYLLVSKNAEGTETEWSNDFVDKTTNQYISGYKNFNNFMSIAIGEQEAQTEWPLRIGSSGPPISGGLYAYFHGAQYGGESGNFQGGYWTSSAPNLIGLYVDEGIRAARLYIMSDRRIKKDVVDIQDDEALNKLRVLQPKKYKYIDPNKGTQEVYGFIAQEVAEVIPYSVRLENSYLPSHMFFCKIINTNVNTSIIDTYVSHTLIVNDFLSFRDNKYNLIEGVKVIEIIDDKTIKVDRIFNKEDTVYTDTTTGETFNDVIYLYGKKIDDFHTLNKDTIWTVATAALQEVDRQLQAEKSKTSDLISRLESLEARVETLESK